MTVITSILYSFSSYIEKIRAVNVGHALGFKIDFSLYDVFFSFMVVLIALNLFRFWGTVGYVEDEDILADTDEFDPDDE